MTNGDANPHGGPAVTTEASLPGELRRAIAAARAKHALAIAVLDLRPMGAFTDYFLICSGQNPRQMQAIADAVESTREPGQPGHIEGYDRAEWILIDRFDFIVHILSPEAREFYQLERLWGNAARVALAE